MTPQEFDREINSEVKSPGGGGGGGGRKGSPHFIVDHIITAGLILVGFALNDLFCTSRDYTVTNVEGNEAPICTITGNSNYHF